MRARGTYYSIDAWDEPGDLIIEQIATVLDPDAAHSIFCHAARLRPGIRVTLRQGGRIVQDSRAASACPALDATVTG